MGCGGTNLQHLHDDVMVICTKISQECVFKAVVIERALSVLCLP